MSDIKEIILDGNPEEYYVFSYRLFLKEFTYSGLFNELRGMPYMKKFFLYIIHYYNSFKGRREPEDCFNKIFKNPLKSLKVIYENKELVEKFNHLLYYNDDKMTFELYGMAGYTREYHLRLLYLEYFLKDKYLELYVAKNKSMISKCLNKYLSNDLIESVCSFLPSKKDIIDKKNIRQNIIISIKNTKIYYRDNNIEPEESYCFNWRHNGGIYGFYLPVHIYSTYADFTIFI